MFFLCLNLEASFPPNKTVSVLNLSTVPLGLSHKSWALVNAQCFQSGKPPVWPGAGEGAREAGEWKAEGEGARGCCQVLIPAGTSEG